MAFTVNFYTFSKREKSTAQPTGAGKAISCTANEPMDLLAPEISLDWRGESGLPTVYNYAYISNFSRYYHVTGWTHRDGLWWASLRVDALASWKSSIGSQNIYVFRSSYEKNGNLVDTIYPTEARRHTVDIPLPKPWTIGGANAAGDTENSGYFVLGIIGSNGTTYHALSVAQMTNLMEYMFSDDYYEDVLGAFGATEYPEAKVAINPMQYITSAKFFPGSVSVAGTWGLKYIDITIGMDIGPVSVGISNPQVSSYRLSTGSAPASNTISRYDITLTDAVRHPQAAVRGGWLNFTPYTSFEIFYPPFGLLTLDPADVSSATHLVIQLSIDPRTLIATLEVESYTTALDHRILLKVEAPVGVDVPLSNIIQPGTSVIQILSSVLGGATSMIGSAASKDPTAIAGAAGAGVGAVFNGIGSAVYGQIPHLSTLGSGGNTAPLSGVPKLYITHWYLVDDDNDGRGRPLMAKRTISNIPGYITADPDEVAISCTEDELSEIRAAIREGFYYA